MPELRKDYLLNEFVIIAKERSKRPQDFIKKNNQIENNNNKINSDIKKDIDFFEKGNENLTPPEIGRRENQNGWYIRYFQNKFPAVLEEGDNNLKTENQFFTFSDAVGTHEVIVDVPDIKDELADLSTEHIKELLKVYNERIIELSKNNKIKYVSVFKNHLEEAGASIKHSHSQVIGLNVVPKNIMKKIEISKKHGKEIYKNIIEIEKKSERFVFENDNAIAFTPFASKYPFELWIFPKRYVNKIEELNEEELIDISKILKSTLLKLKEINAPYNFFIHYAPNEHEMHLHFIICPRLNLYGGFELSTEIIINTVSPEEAAKFYKSKNK